MGYSSVIVTDRRAAVQSLTLPVARETFAALDAIARRHDLRRGHAGARLLAGVLQRPELVAELLAEAVEAA
jgi:hypothetical protein